jgi:probable phosphoglycerate mutase
MVQTAILARHGESEFSAKEWVNGDRTAAVRLTERGREQARALGETLADEPIGLCVVSEFERVQETARLALAGRDVPLLVVPELNEIGFGRYEGGHISSYREWAYTATPVDDCPGGGESRAGAVIRFVRGYRIVLARPEPTVLVVGHGLAVRYVLNALAGTLPAPVMDQVPCGEAYRIPAAELEEAIDRLEAWSRAPAWT